MRRAPALRAALVSAVAAGMLTACSGDVASEEANYTGDYSSHPPLKVVGYPSTGSLGITQQVVWRIADGKADELASLTSDDRGEGVAEKTAKNWIDAFRKGAGGQVTAEFYDEGSYRQTVVLYLHGTGQIKEIHVRPVRLEGEDKEVWGVNMAEPDPGEATAVRPWVPKTPGERGSKMVP
ncbi:hypothetical protein [Streptomyces sp. WM6368]|uniref:hypothetical protein n=1 Tax=Streptomyces sp. WM6368 TaxID=1415554 RepID=UPI0006AF5224|nr:hypothetical protein [Streptomyces sp. WM6368]KOU15685.1 hypothetical protein ADK51_32595 [Streptomyces sp. WM6368]